MPPETAPATNAATTTEATAQAAPTAQNQPPPAGADGAASAAATGTTTTSEGGAPKAPESKPENQAGFALRKERARAKALVAQLGERDAANAKELAGANAKIAELEAKVAAILKSPLREAEKAGVDLDQEIRGYVTQTSPEKRLAELEEQIRAERKAREDDETKRVEGEKARAQQQASAATEQRVTAFTDAACNAEKYPYMNINFTRDEIQTAIREGDRLAREGKLRTESRSLEAFLSLLEGNAKKVHTARQEQAQKLLAAKAAPESATESKNGQAKAARKTTAEKPPVAARSEPAKAPLARTRNVMTQADHDAVAALKRATEQDRTYRTNGASAKPAAKH